MSIPKAIEPTSGFDEMRPITNLSLYRTE